MRWQVTFRLQVRNGDVTQFVLHRMFGMVDGVDDLLVFAIQSVIETKNRREDADKD